ncbi:MAG: Ferric transporter ATP-binding subunit [Rhodospirillales bacterium]|nr:Ferric transporter ATP-binding subunit [Rhodospirillales bacterium]
MWISLQRQSDAVATARWTAPGVAVFFLVAAVGLPAAAQDWDAVVAAAKTEGSVTLYSSATAPQHRQVAKAFESATGIRVDILDLRASEQRERVRMEQTSGRFLGDVLQNGSVTMRHQAAEQAFQPHGDIPAIAGLRAPFAADALQVPNFVMAYGMLVNVNSLKPEERPRSWHDLLDPRWRGRLLADDFRAIGGGQTFFAATYDAFGAAFHDRLKAQSPVFSRGVGESERRVASGEYPIRFPQQFPNYVALKGLPVTLVLAEEGAPYVQFDLAVLRNAPHPNAAKLLIDFYLRPKGQLLYANNALIPVVEGIIEKTDPEMRELASAKLLGSTTAERQDEMLALATRLYQ